MPNDAKGSTGSQNKGADGEYMGLVFIIRELNKEKGEYDAFITTGGIQEVKPPAPIPNNGAGGHAPPSTVVQSLQSQQQKLAAATFVKDDEDSEYFGPTAQTRCAASSKCS